MADRLNTLRVALGATALILALPAWSQEPPPPPPPPPPVAPATEPDPLAQWLDEVRAQRHAWEDRRRAAKEAMEARRRWIDPWGAAQHEAREQENQRRREALREQIARDREAFRNQPPWGPLYGPMPDDSMGLPADAQGQPDPDGSGTDATTQEPTIPGWDNRWYYRGY